MDSVGGRRRCALSSEGYEIVIVDNLSRRKIDIELGCESLTPIQPIDCRIRTWQALTGKTLEFHNLNIAEEYSAGCS
jgi:UDP-sulfoquinovose synthase